MNTPLLYTYRNGFGFVDAIPESLRNSLIDDQFKVYAKATEEEVELLMHGAVGDGWDHLDSRSVASFLAKNRNKRVNVRINSPGGLVFDGIAIHNALVNHEGEVNAIVEGVAASAATIVMMAADKIRVYRNATMMVHRAWGVAIGNRRDMEDMVDILDKIDAAIVATYAARTGKSEEELYKLLDGKKDGTWFTATEAIAAGFADELVEDEPDEDEEIEATATAKVADDTRKVAAKSLQSRLVKLRLDRLSE